jgi:hypothetical protein
MTTHYDKFSELATQMSEISSGDDNLMSFVYEWGKAGKYIETIEPYLPFYQTEHDDIPSFQDVLKRDQAIFKRYMLGLRRYVHDIRESYQDALLNDGSKHDIDRKKSEMTSMLDYIKSSEKRYAPEVKNLEDAVASDQWNWR